MAEDVHKPGGSERSGFSPTPKQIAAAVLAVLLLVFVLQNTDSAQVNVLVFDVEAPLWLVLAVTIVVSVLIGILIGTRRAKPSKKK